MSGGAIDFRPFQAWRYPLGQVELARVIAPPYDVISPGEQEALYAKSPFNVVRLILGKEANFYENARKCWEEWTKKGILVQDPEPAFYLYEQVFRHPADAHPMRRLALLGILKLNSTDSVLRHEATFEGPRKDRFLLFEKTRTNLSPVFGLYSDAGKCLSTIFSSYRESLPLFQARDDAGILHQGWAVREENDQRAIREALRGEKILIADGHHRYETALEYRNQMHRKGPAVSGETPYDFVMMALVAMEDKGLLALPTHRLIRSFGSSSKTDFLNQLHKHFDFRPLPEKELFSELNRQAETEKVFGGIFREEGSFLLRLKNFNEVRRSLPPGKPPLWYEIEANLLTRFVFGALWKIPTEELRELIEYTPSSEEAIQAVREGRAQAAFLLRPPKIETIRRLAEAGEKMPQKTTYFYPKLASGLFFYHHG